MKQLDIKEYIANEKEKLKSISTEKIKLGIIDGTTPDNTYIQ